MLLRIAQGDAYGHGAEYIKFPRDQAVYDQVMKFEKYVKHPVHNLEAGQYTDDAQMSRAVLRFFSVKCNISTKEPTTPPALATSNYVVKFSSYMGRCFC